MRGISVLDGLVMMVAIPINDGVVMGGVTMVDGRWFVHPSVWYHDISGHHSLSMRGAMTPCIA